MNRIDKKLQQLKAENKKALITYVTCGDGGYDTTESAVLKMAENGADIIELGVPFSDPIAEGPVIQAASDRALKNGTTLKGIFEMVKRLRSKTNIPLLLMMYVNSIFRFGTEKFFTMCEDTGIDGVIVPDLPFEEKEEIQESADKHSIINISLITPTSTDRISMIAKEAKGFVYCVSSTGVTGMRSRFTTDFNQFIGEIKKHTDTPCAIGFGISGPEQAKNLKQYCDGVIVGSAIVNIIGKNGKDSAEMVGKFTNNLRTALDE